MQIALSDLKVNVGKYVDLADTEDKEPWHAKKLPENHFGGQPIRHAPERHRP
jgi:hypothetical protein